MDRFAKDAKINWNRHTTPVLRDGEPIGRVTGVEVTEDGGLAFGVEFFRSEDARRALRYDGFSIAEPHSAESSASRDEETGPEEPVSRSASGGDGRIRTDE